MRSSSVGRSRLSGANGATSTVSTLRPQGGATPGGTAASASTFVTRGRTHRRDAVPSQRMGSIERAAGMLRIEADEIRLDPTRQETPPAILRTFADAFDALAALQPHYPNRPDVRSDQESGRRPVPPPGRSLASIRGDILHRYHSLPVGEVFDNQSALHAFAAITHDVYAGTSHERMYCGEQTNDFYAELTRRGIPASHLLRLSMSGNTYRGRARNHACLFYSPRGFPPDLADSPERLLEALEEPLKGGQMLDPWSRTKRTVFPPDATADDLLAHCFGSMREVDGDFNPSTLDVRATSFPMPQHPSAARTGTDLPGVPPLERADSLDSFALTLHKEASRGVRTEPEWPPGVAADFAASFDRLAWMHTRRNDRPDLAQASQQGRLTLPPATRDLASIRGEIARRFALLPASVVRHPAGRIEAHAEVVRGVYGDAPNQEAGGAELSALLQSHLVDHGVSPRHLLPVSLGATTATGAPVDHGCLLYRAGGFPGHLLESGAALPEAIAPLLEDCVLLDPHNANKRTTFTEGADAQTLAGVCRDSLSEVNPALDPATLRIAPAVPPLRPAGGEPAPGAQPDAGKQPAAT